MINPNRPFNEWLDRQQDGHPAMGNPPSTTAPNPLMHNPSQIPFATRDDRMLTPDEDVQRQKWMAEETQRVIAERQTTQLPSQPQVNQIHDPRARPNGPTLQQRQVTDMASQLTDRLAQRDRGNGFF